VVHEEGAKHLSANPKEYDVIVAQELIEHFAYDELVSLLIVMRHALRPSGLVVLETLNCANIVYGTYLLYCDHTHRMGFTPRSLAEFLPAVGIDVQGAYPVKMSRLWDIVVSMIPGRRQASVPGETNTQGLGGVAGSGGLGSRLWHLHMFLLKRAGVALSTGLSRLLVAPYDVSLGACHRVYTPTFTMVGGKREAES
jgi:hypothetical protein